VRCLWNALKRQYFPVLARPVHLAIIDGIESIAGSELPRNVNLTKPNVLLAGFNPVPLRN
jgi:hypothetical protein